MNKLVVHGVTAGDIINYISKAYDSDELLSLSISRYSIDNELDSVEDISSEIKAVDNVVETSVDTPPVIDKNEPVTIDNNTIPVISSDNKNKPEPTASLDKTSLKQPTEQHYDTNKQLLYVYEQFKKTIAWINCDIRDISDEHGDIACAKLYVDNKCTVIINSGTYKFKTLKGNTQLLSMHIAECIFRCILEDSNSKIELSKLDELMNIFYNKFYERFTEN